MKIQQISELDAKDAPQKEERRFFHACPLCQQKNLVPKFSLRSVQLFQCRSCSMMFLNPYVSPEQLARIYENQQKLTEAHSRLSSYFQNLEGSQTEKFYDHCLEKISSWIPGPTRSLLDIGAGNGYFLWRAKQKGWSVKGIDPSVENSQFAREHFQIQITPASFENYAAEGLFDCLTLWDIIEHVPDPLGMLQKAYSLLKPGGILLIATPNHDSLINFLAEASYCFSLGVFQGAMELLFVPEHILYFTVRTIRPAVEHSGFSILELSKTGTDIDRYHTSIFFNQAAKMALRLASWLHWENRLVVIARKRAPETQ